MDAESSVPVPFVGRISWSVGLEAFSAVSEASTYSSSNSASALLSFTRACTAAD